MNLGDRVIDIFKQISQVPRQSKHEELISQWLADRAAADGFDYTRDAVGNVIVRVPATPGYESAPIVILQGHMDMVCEKTPDSPHDFAHDPICVIEEDGWMHADRTTLGADDGLGVATALAIAEDGTLPHPALELFITVDEETGMTGANAFDPADLKGRILLNIDSEDEGVFTVGSAGGRETSSSLPLVSSAIPDGSSALTVHVSGLRGGHSGTDIICGRANALKLVARIADRIAGITDGARLVDIRGGSAHNAIPRDAVLTITIPGDKVGEVSELIEKLGEVFASEFKSVEPELSVSYKVSNIAGVAFDYNSLRRVIDLILVYPHGVAAMSHDIAGLVETSSNLASIRVENSTLKLLSSQRSSVQSKLDALTSRIESAVRLAGGHADSAGGYPAWSPDMESDVLRRCVEAYKGRFGHEPKIEIIHAGLECSIIGSKIPDMQMISFGPTVQSPHSPKERAEIKTVGMVADFLADLLKGYRA